VDIVCRTTEGGGLPTLMASGELDLATVPAFRSAVNRLVDDASGRTVAIDLDGLTVLDDTGLGILLIAVGMAAGAVIYWDLSRRGWKTVAE